MDTQRADRFNAELTGRLRSIDMTLTWIPRAPSHVADATARLVASKIEQAIAACELFASGEGFEEPEPPCEWCNGTGIAEEQTDVDNFIDVDCNCAIGRERGDIY
jgi:hypothetical protein